MARPVLALLSDFGVRDHYVAAMKAVALGICPDASIVDVTHDIPPQDIAAGAFELAAAAPYFPPRTVFIAVVDPGVGSARQAVAVATKDHLFVAPDNGLLTRVLQLAPSWRAVVLTNPQYARATISRTFEGRDRFAPAGAWLAAGVPLDALGPPLDRLVTLSLPLPVADADGVRGEVVRVDRFGNLITNIDRPSLERLGMPVRVELDGATAMPLVATYADAPAGTFCALVGSGGYLELSVNGGSAAQTSGRGAGAVVRVRRAA